MRVTKPDLDAPRISNVTPSLGFRPERNEQYEHLDIFRLSIEPGTTVTFIVELASASVPRLYLTSPSNFGKRQRESALFRGILLGITGIIAIFLTAIFAANHKLVFPATALVAWAALSYLCVDFGFWDSLFQSHPRTTAPIERPARHSWRRALSSSFTLF